MIQVAEWLALSPFVIMIPCAVALEYGLDGLGSIPGVRGVEIFSLRVQTGPGVHSASYKMSTGGFPRC